MGSKEEILFVALVLVVVVSIMLWVIPTKKIT
jgi:hypothetical protein